MEIVEDRENRINDSLCIFYVRPIMIKKKNKNKNGVIASDHTVLLIA